MSLAISSFKKLMGKEECHGQVRETKQKTNKTKIARVPMLDYLSH